MYAFANPHAYPRSLQAAFCKELRDNLGARLEKRGQELEALSDQIAALVRTTTTQITALEKAASDQVSLCGGEGKGGKMMLGRKRGL